MPDLFTISVDGAVEAEEVPLPDVPAVLARIAQEPDFATMPGAYGEGQQTTIVVERAA